MCVLLQVSLVNGMHTCLAFITMREQAAGAAVLECKDYDLITYDKATPAVQQEMWSWSVMRCLMLLEEYGIDMLKVTNSINSY
jgi:hypothetical protein